MMEDTKQNDSTVSYNKEGYAPIKQEYINKTHVKRLSEYQPKEPIEALENKKYIGEPSEKKAKYQFTGRNKKRAFDPLQAKANKLCVNVINEEKCTRDKCDYSHDVKLYVENKPVNPLKHEALARCAYRGTGKCKYGVTCLFSDDHVDPVTFKNIVNDSIYNPKRIYTLNALENQGDLQRKLWKRKYDFSPANKIIKELESTTRELGALRKSVLDAGGKLMNISTQSTGDENSKVDEKTDINATTSLCDHTNRESSGGEQQGSVQGKHVEASSSTPQLVVVKESLQTQENASIGPRGDGTARSKVKEQVNLNNLSEDSKTNGEGLHGTVAVSETNGEVGGEVKANHKKIPESKEQLRYNELMLSLDKFDAVISDRRGRRAVDFTDKLYLAPLTTVGNLPFRRLCVGYGADITCGEMALSVPVLKAQQSEWSRLKRHESEKIFGIQLCGSFLDTMTRCTQLIQDNLQCDFIDINCGCPIDAIYKKGEGAGLMARQNRLENIIRGVSRQLCTTTSSSDTDGDLRSPPELTVKLRTGVHEGQGQQNAHKLIPNLEKLGVSMVTVHGRSREQRYTKRADWSYIDHCSKSAVSMPVFGNGDILSYEDYKEHRENTGVAGCMIARGALIKPWIFTEIKEQRTWDISSGERLDMLAKFCSHGLEHWGSDERGVATTRRFLMEALSFLHRYIPVGLLEVLPQRINDKPHMYYGRNDLETMMASPNCSDWVKISEMLLGPVTSGYQFIPKHKANSYA